MMLSFFPIKKLRRNLKFVILVVVLSTGVLAAYLEFVSKTNSWNGVVEVSFRKNLTFPERQEDECGAPSDYKQGPEMGQFLHRPEPWRSEYKGQANLHIFEDWCGSSVDQLRKNMHYPLFPHLRTTVKRLAVSPQWTNYGLRVFGYLHPYADGQYQFAIASDDNSEFWLSLDDCPLKLRLLALVGKMGSEWSAPGEFGKYASQTSNPVWLTKKQRYFFEILHKQNDRGTDHVEVAWRLNQAGQEFRVISSQHISLYTNESALKMNVVGHIPLTAASYVGPPRLAPGVLNHSAEMLRADPRDTLYQIPLVKEALLYKVLPDCSYKPSYIIKGLPLLRYQGLQFVHMSYVYPNDYTRLTHMESYNKCFYRETLYYLDRFGFFKYMKMDDLRNKGLGLREWKKGGMESFRFEDPGMAKKRRDYGIDFADYAFMRKRKLLLVPLASGPTPLTSTQGLQPVLRTASARRRSSSKRRRHPRQRLEVSVRGQEEGGRMVPGQLVSEPAIRGTNATLKRPLSKLKWKLHRAQSTQAPSVTRTPQSASSAPLPQRKRTTGPQLVSVVETRRRWATRRRGGLLNGEHDGMGAVAVTLDGRAPGRGAGDTTLQEDSEGDLDYEVIPPAVLFDPEVKWSQTFDVSPLDLHSLRSDWISLHCNVSGNLLLSSSDALPVVEAFMKKLNKKNRGRFSLLRVVNVEKRADGLRGSRYLLELELEQHRQGRVRLSHYIYVLRRPGRHGQPQAPKGEQLLCHPLGFAWDPAATVHLVVPVKNQARWVLQFIVDMEELYRVTGDKNFNIIITDYNSTDMDVELALKSSALPRYQYKKLSGNFERSAGLQAGIDLITDPHSIVFLCDLHIHFPPSIIDSVRKHCVEGKMAFAPIVMRLDCGATPYEPNGFWEVNGFGLLGIYKSDLMLAGGMNTKDFRDRWGGEDWELLDRILEAGLEVERIYLRNFMHHYHSKRGMWNRQST